MPKYDELFADAPAAKRRYATPKDADALFNDTPARANFAGARGSSSSTAEGPETTWGELAGGVAADITQGVVRQGRNAVNLVLPAVGGISNPLVGLVADRSRDAFSESAQRALDTLEQSKGAAYRSEQARRIVETDAAGSFTGLNLPSAEQVLGTAFGSAPAIPQMLAGGGWARSAIGKALGYGVGNASVVAPEQYEDSYRAALAAGKSEEESRAIAEKAGVATAFLAALTGGAGLTLGGRIGAGATNPVSAAARGVAADAPFEFVEEGGQNAIASLAAGLGIDPFDVLNSGALGALATAGPGGVSGVIAQRGQAQAAAELEALERGQRVAAAAPMLQPVAAPIEPDLARAAPAGAIDPRPAAVDPFADLPIVEPSVPRGTAPVAAQDALGATIAPGVTPTLPPGASVTMPPPVQPEGQIQAIAALAPVIQQILAGNAAAAPTVPGVPDTAISTPAAPVVPGATPATTRVAAAPGVVPPVSKPTQAAPAAPVAPVEPEPRGQFFRKGKNAEAVQAPGGEWYVRHKVANQWQPWEKRDTFDASPTFGYEPAIAPTGSVRVPGVGRITVGDRVTAGPAAPKAPATLPERLARSPRGLDRAAFQAAGFDPALFGQKTGMGYVFRRSGGMTPAELREWMQSEGYLQQDPESGEAQVYDDDAVQLLDRAINGGERIVSESDLEAEMAYQDALQQDREPAVDAPPEPEEELDPDDVRRADLDPATELERLRAENARQRGELRTDSLTGISNRRAFDEDVAAGKGRVTIAFDLDLFKWYNDNLGHSFGDRLLQQFAKELADTNPFGGNFRFGGDEFVATAESREEAEAIVADLEAALARVEQEWEGPNGEVVTITGIPHSAGIGGDFDAADASLAATKATKRDARSGGVPSNVTPLRRGSDRAGVQAAPSQVPERDGARDDGAPAQVTPAPAPPEPPAPTAPPEPPAPKPFSTSTKNAQVDTEREARGAKAILRDAAQTHPELLEQARAALRKDPTRAREMMDLLRRDGTVSISALGEAILLVEKVNLMTARDAAARRASNESISADARRDAKIAWSEAENAINDIDLATRTTGAEWGRLGAFRRRLVRSDWSFEALAARRAAVLGRDLKASEKRAVRAEADAIDAKVKAADASHEATVEAAATNGVKITYENLAAEIAKALRGDKGKARPKLEKLKAWADESKAVLRDMRGRFSSGVDPTQFFHLARIGAYVIADGAVQFGAWVKRMQAELGEMFEGARSEMRAVYSAAKIMDVEAANAKPKAVAAAIDPENVTHRDVYNLARAHVLDGVKGEDAVMKATHADLAEIVEGITERDVRRLFSDYGKVAFPSKDADKVALRELRALVQLQESIDRLEEGLAALKSGPQRDKQTAAVREKRRRLNDLLKLREQAVGPDPTKLATYQQARAENLRNQIEDIERQIEAGKKDASRPAAPAPNREIQILTETRDRLRKDLEAIDKGPPPTKEQRYQRARSKAFARELEEVRAREKAGDYAKRPRPVPPALDAKNRKAQYELVQAKASFARKQFELEMSQRPRLQRWFLRTIEGTNLARALMTSFDLSAVLRQGGFITFARPVRAAKLLPTMMRAAVSAEFASDIEMKLANRPNASLYKIAGLDMPDPHSHDLSKLEEAYMSRLIEAAPIEGLSGGKLARRKLRNLLLAPVRGSARAFTTFLNLLRADSFDAMVASLPLTEAPTKRELEAIGNFINVATGRGKIGVGSLTAKGNAAAGLNTIFFAPKLVASRFNLLFGQPFYGGNKRTRALVAQEYARFIAGMATTLFLAAAAFDDEDDGEPFMQLDPRHTDFLRMRFGNAYVDIMTGLSQVTVFSARVFSGEKITSKGDFVMLRDKWRWNDLVEAAGGDREPYKYAKPRLIDDDVGDIIGRFIRTKLAPVPAVVTNLAIGEDVIGQDVTVLGQAGSLIAPLSLRNIFDLLRDNGVPEGPAIFAVEVFGAGVQYRDPGTYDKDKATSRSLLDELNAMLESPP